MPTMSKSERKKTHSRGSTGKHMKRRRILVDAIVLDDHTREYIDALLECFYCPDARLVGLSLAKREDRIKEILNQDPLSAALSADCKSFADLQALARMYRQVLL
jgi:hypothetical protein